MRLTFFDRILRYVPWGEKLVIHELSQDEDIGKEIDVASVNREKHLVAAKKLKEEKNFEGMCALSAIS